jgi:ribonuclease BN (tRNA processing enzyme)
MGTGWGNVIRPNQKGASVFVELGNGDSFVFDTGPGCGINYNVMQVPASRMTRIFLTHLHLDHTSDLAWIYAFGPAGEPLHAAASFRAHRRKAGIRNQGQYRGYQGAQPMASSEFRDLYRCRQIL